MILDTWSNSISLNDKESPFFFMDENSIIMDNWNKYFPYQLLILNCQKDGDTVHYQSTPYQFTLPIPPQEINISMPFASTVEATPGGIVETHGGAPFRDITLSGTTGTTPIKNQVFSGPDLGAFPQSIFGGTVNNTLSVASAISSLLSSNTNSGILDTGILEFPDPSGAFIPARSTGYYKIKLLEKFLETYAEVKKGSIDVPLLPGLPFPGGMFNGKDLRLGLAIWKDKAIYLCTGVNFSIKKTAGKPMSHTFSLTLKAWKRIRPTGRGTDSISVSSPSKNLMLALLKRINAATEAVESLSKSIQSVVNDPINRLKEIIDATQNFIKVSAGEALTIKNFPDSIKKDILTYGLSQYAKIKSLDPSLPPLTKSQIDEMVKNISSNSISKDFETTKDALSAVNPSNLSLPSKLNQSIQQYKNQVKSQTRKDFETFRDTTKDLSLNIAALCGAGGSTLFDIYNKPKPKAVQVPTEDIYDLLFALNELSQILDYLAVSSKNDPNVVTSIDYVAGLAERSGIAFIKPTSKLAVPFPYNHTLERLAQMYLGDPNRWMEIATLNGLRAPYVDEVGFKLNFITNGSGNSIYVNSSKNLAVNHRCWISSNNQKKSRRTITGIEKLYENAYEVIVDGESNLNLFTIDANATLEAFLPGTTNSQQLIYVPSTASAPVDPQTKSIPGINEFDPLLQVSGIDLLLDQSGDLAMTPDGDCKVAYGLANILQSVKLALSTPIKALPLHLNYGLNVKTGQNTADVAVNDVVKQISGMFQGDETFERVENLSVIKNGPVLEIKMVLVIRGVAQNVPISFNLNLI